MYLVLNFLLQNIINLYCAMTVSFCLTPKYSRLRSLTVYSIVGFFIYILKFSSFDNQIVITLSALSVQLTFILFTLLAFTDSVFKKLVTFSVILFGNIMAEYIALIILNAMSSYTLALEPDTKEFTIAILLVLPVQIILNQMFLFFWKYTTYKKSTLTIFIFSLIPMLQLFLYACFFLPALLDYTVINSSLIIMCSLIAFLADIILLYVILRRQEKQNIQAAYLELQELYRMESEYYQTLEARHEELSKMRHDYNNHLATLYVLISSGKTEAAKELTASLKKQLCTTTND